MNGERLFRILGWVDEYLIEEADTASSPAVSRRRPRWGRAVCRLLKFRQARTCAPHFCSNCRVRFAITRSMVRSSSVRVLSSRMKLKA